MTKSHHSSDEGEANGFSTKGKANGHSSSRERTKSGITCESEITFNMISNRFKDYILHEKPGLQRFYESNTREGLDDYLKEPVERALHMANTIRHKGCSWETCLSLSLIALYDIVMLIGRNYLPILCSSGLSINILPLTSILTLRGGSLTYEIQITVCP